MAEQYICASGCFTALNLSHHDAWTLSIAKSSIWISTHSSDHEYPLPEIFPLCARCDCRPVDCQASLFVETYVYLPSRVISILTALLALITSTGTACVTFSLKAPSDKNRQHLGSSLVSHPCTWAWNRKDESTEPVLWILSPLSWEPIIQYTEPCTQEFIILCAPSMTDEECIGLPQLVSMLQRVVGKQNSWYIVGVSFIWLSTLKHIPFIE